MSVSEFIMIYLFAAAGCFIAIFEPRGGRSDFILSLIGALIWPLLLMTRVFIVFLRK